MSGDWTQYYRRETSGIFSRHSREWYEYKDKNVKILPANLPMPPTESFYWLFNGCNQLKDISALANWNVSNIKDMGLMFNHCTQLHDISALANWDVSNVKDMSHMFDGCDRLQNITALANWDVSNVKNMSYMFYNCVQLKISDNTISVKSYLRNLPEYSYPKQDHTALLNHLWNRVKPLLKDTTKLNGYFKRFGIEAPVKVSVKTESVKEPIKAPNQTAISLQLPSDWQNIELPQWNP